MAEEKVDGRSLRYQERRRELLAGSMRYVVQNGITDLSLRPLAKSLGIPHSSLTAHFGTKENLIAEILAQMRTATTSVVSLPAASADGQPESFAPYDEWWWTWTKDHFLPALQLTYEMLGYALRHRDRYEDALRHAIDDWLVIFRPFMRACGCPEEQVDEISTSAIAHMTGLQIDLLATGDRERVDSAHRSFMRMMQARQREWLG